MIEQRGRTWAYLLREWHFIRKLSNKRSLAMCCFRRWVVETLESIHINFFSIFFLFLLLLNNLAYALIQNSEVFLVECFELSIAFLNAFILIKDEVEKEWGQIFPASQVLYDYLNKEITLLVNSIQKKKCQRHVSCAPAKIFLMLLTDSPSNFLLAFYKWFAFFP